jgi:S1-C subfamily serine protease
LSESLYAHLGLQNGDTVVTVAGKPLVSADEALKLYRHIRDAKPGESIVVTLVRRNTPLTFTYTLR